MIEIRPATLKDLDDIMIVEASTFAPVGDGAAASREVMAHRISLLNDESPGWFFVACYRGRVIGNVILQPTDLVPDECTSWNSATDNGCLERTFCRGGKNIYGVSLAVTRGAPAGTSELLIHRAFLAWCSTGRSRFMFCSRVPGFSAASRKMGVTIDEYIMQRRRTGGPRDPLLHTYWRWTGGAEPIRVLHNGYPVDKESGGHGALFALTDSLSALCAMAVQIYGAGLSARAVGRVGGRYGK